MHHPLEWQNGPVAHLSWSSDEAALLDLPLEVLTDVCEQLDLHDLVRVAKTCKHFRNGDGGLEMELPTNQVFASGDGTAPACVPCRRADPEHTPHRLHGVMDRVSGQLRAAAPLP